MQVAVCMKRVPDTATKIRIAAGGKNIESADVQSIISPYDEFAIEEALRLKEKSGQGLVTAYSVGTEATVEKLRQALAMGVDEAVLVKTAQALDPAQIAANLAHALKPKNCDLVLFGRQSTDEGGSQVGPLTAALLGHVCITDVVKLEITGKRVRAEREIEGGREVIETELPVVITAQKGLNEPRYASLKGIMAAKKKPLQTVDAIATPLRLEVLTLEPPAPRPDGRIVGEGTEAVAELVKLLRSEAKVL
ncbi:MAG: electron transfer flavoprotein subunit beta/FixA family protein [Planctomycetota bacterium]